MRKPDDTAIPMSLEYESAVITPSSGQSPRKLEYQPDPLFRPSYLQDDSAIAEAHGKRIGILVVTYNALSTISSVLKRITPNVWRNVEEVVVSDDYSSDSTYELAVGLRAIHDLPKLTVLKHSRNLGYGGNQKAGYEYFIRRGFDIVVMLHGDGQYAPEILAHLYHPIVSGKADAVFGSRMMSTYGGPLRGGMPLYKFIGNRILTYVENKLLKMNLSEFHSGYRAYSLDALREIECSQMTNDFHFDTEIIVKLHHQKYRIAEVPIPTYYGKEICRVNGLKYARDVVRAVYRYRATCRSLRRYPEFDEYFVQYTRKVMRYSSHHWAQVLVGRNREVLDVGSGQGLLARELSKNGNRVVGVDALSMVPPPIHFDEYHSLDLDADATELGRLLAGRKFDRILLLDVLEHLRSPDQLVRACLVLLRSDGQLIISLPNFANVSIRLMLLFGRFCYAERGILDRTHLRFFTFRSARKMLEDCGLDIVEVKATNIPLELLVPLDPAGGPMRTLNTVLRIATCVFPNLLGYQAVFVARPHSTSWRKLDGSAGTTVTPS